jgi:ubiquinone/menaquinone biosynthesis C-methylase UbiE
MKRTSSEIYNTRKKFFNDHADKWLGMWYKDSAAGDCHKHENDFQRLFSLLPLKPGDHVLDAGCGTGVLVPFIMERITATGILHELDFAEMMIETNRRQHLRDNIRFIVADVEQAPLEAASCDVAVCFSCFPHFQDKTKSIQTLSRILKPQGVLVVSHFDSAEGINIHHGSCPAVRHDHLPGEHAMRTLLNQNGFQVEEFIDEPGFYYVQARTHMRRLK